MPVLDTVVRGLKGGTMRATGRLAWRVLGLAAFGATAALAVVLSSRGPVDAGLVSSGSSVVAVPACGDASLVVSVRPGAAGRFDVEFTNVSAMACELRGYPPVVATDGARSLGGVTGRLVTDRLVTAAAVVLRPGATAYAPGRLTVAGCQTVAVSGLRIGLPGRTAGRYVRYAVSACESGGHVLLRVGAIRPTG